MSQSQQPVKPDGGNIEYNHDPRRLKRRRVAKGMSLTRAATSAGCSKSHLSKLEHGHYGASPGLLAKFAEVYGCEIVDLMPAETVAA
jgi:transcriptional regulator with XRE-family HTH domain